MRNVIVETKLTINLTRDDWQLYSTVTQLEADAINARMEQALNNACDYREGFAAADRVLMDFVGFGANDTEPRAVVAALMKLRFPQTFKS